MSTFIQKLRVVTLGTAHDLLDKAIDLNSPSALRQYVRDLEDAIDKLKNESAIQAGQLRTLNREVGDLQHKVESDTSDAQKYSAAGKTDLARAKASSAIRSKEQLDATNDQIKTQTVTFENLKQAITNLESKHADMVFQVRKLERLDLDTKAKEGAARSLSAAGRLSSGGSDISIDDIESKMTARNDVASEKLNQSMGDLTGPSDPEHEAQVDDFLASLNPKAAGASK